MKENNLDKCIRANFKMVENDIAAASCMSIFVVLLLMTIFVSFLSLIPLFLTIVFLYKMYQKLFYTSVYGEMAATYQSLPASAAEMTAAKIFVAGLGNIICGTTYAVVISILVMYFGADGIGDIIWAFNRLGGGIAAAVLPLGIISLIVASFAQSALIFLAVAAYNSVINERKKGVYRFLIVAGTCAVNLILSEGDALFEKLGIDSLIIPSGAGIVIGLVVMVLCYRKTVKLMEERYEWG